MHPEDKQTWYIGVASGGVWKTTNAGTTFTPVFENEGSLLDRLRRRSTRRTRARLGRHRRGQQPAQRRLRRRRLSQRRCRPDVAEPRAEELRAHRPHRHRSARLERRLRRGPGAAVERGRRPRPVQDHRRRRELDEGPRTSARTPASATSRSIPRNPDVLLAAAHQRRRHIWTLINGGPESGLHKSTDGGKTWRRIRTGLPGGDLGRIVLAFSPAQKGLVYAMVEAAGQPGRSTRSLDSGDSWERRGNVQAQPMYYENILADPKDRRSRLRAERADAGLGRRRPHVPRRSASATSTSTTTTSGSIPTTPITCSRAATAGSTRAWDRRPAVASLQQPAGHAVLQRRRRQRVAVLQRLRRHAGQQHARRPVALAQRRTARPTTTGSSSPAATASSPASIRPIRTSSTPSRSTAASSASTAGPASASASSPVEDRGEPALRLNWDSPFIISPHNPTRLYFGASRLFRSDDRGNTLEAGQSRT